MATHKIRKIKKKNCFVRKTSSGRLRQMLRVEGQYQVQDSALSNKIRKHYFHGAFLFCFVCFGLVSCLIFSRESFSV